MSAALDVIRARLPDAQASIGLVLGLGLGAVQDRLEDPVTFYYEDLPDFPISSVSSQKGALILGRIGSVRVAVLTGRVHAYETGDASVMFEPLGLLSELGVDDIILTNASGSLRNELPPGSLIAIHDHIHFMGRNPLIGVHDDHRFVDMYNAYDADIRTNLSASASAQGIVLREGVLMWLMGPSFETPAEVNAARTLGADVIGMSIAPETIMCRYLGMRVGALSVITTQGAGMMSKRLSHQESQHIARSAATRLSKLIVNYISTYY